MGMFKEVSPEKRKEWSNQKHEKAREKLTKKGFDLTGLLILDDSFGDGAFEYLLVFPDRVEYVNDGKPSLLGKKGKGVETIPISRISSISTNKRLVFEIIHITTSGQSIEFKSDPYNAPILKSKILELMNTPQTTSAAPSLGPATGVSAADELKKLAELHQQGFLTTEEFTQAKSRVLNSGSSSPPVLNSDSIPPPVTKRPTPPPRP